MSEPVARTGVPGAKARVLPAAAAESVQPWSLPAVEGPVLGRRRAAAGEQRGERAERQARYDEARAAGLAAAREEIAARLAELDRQIARFGAAVDALAAPLASLDAEVERELVRLAVTVGTHLARRELKSDPGRIVAVIRETVALLPLAAREVRVHLHPEDATLVRERLAAPHAERAWSIVEDPVLARGGCRVTAESSEIDARLETRVAATIAQLLGEERAVVRAEREGA